MRTSSRTRLLGWVCVVCGALVAIAGFLLDSQAAGAVTADTATARFANGLFGVAVLGLMGGVLGLWSLRVGGSGWLPWAATVVALVGLLLWTVGGLYLTTDASADQALTPAGGLVSSIGMIALGIAVLRARVLSGWRRLVPLLVGAWFFVQLPLQVAFFIGVRGSPLTRYCSGSSARCGRWLATSSSRTPAKADTPGRRDLRTEGVLGTSRGSARGRRSAARGRLPGPSGPSCAR
jgi:hypothetical protein